MNLTRYRFTGLFPLLGMSLLILSLASCVSPGGSASAPAQGGAGPAGELPEWYLDPQIVYPTETFLTAIGSGDTRRDAEQQALAGLSQVFEAEVRVDQRTSERYSEIMGAQGNMSESEVRLAQDTNVRSNQTLLNVQFGEAAVDDLGQVHVIAYIERLPTARVYSDLIETNGEQVELFLDESEAGGGLVRSYAYLSAAAVVSQANEVLREQLRIIAPGFSQMVSLGYEPDVVLQRRADLATRMRVAVQIAGDDTGRIEGLIREALSEERFPTGDEDPVLQVRGAMRIEDGESNNDFLSVRWSLTLDMSGPDGNTLVTFDEQSRASAISREAAD